MKKNLLVKILLAMLALSLVIGMAACGNKNTGSGDGGKKADTTPPAPEEKALSAKLAGVVGGLDGYLKTIDGVDSVMFIDATIGFSISDAYAYSITAKGNLYKEASATNQNELAVEIKDKTKTLLAAYLVGDKVYLSQSLTAANSAMTNSKITSLGELELNKNASKIFNDLLPTLQGFELSVITDLLEENGTTIDGLIEGTGVVTVEETDAAYTIAIQSDKIVDLLNQAGALIDGLIPKDAASIVDTVVSIIFGVDSYADLKKATPDQIAKFPKISIVANKAAAGGISGLEINYISDLLKDRAGDETLALAIDLAVDNKKGNIGFNGDAFKELAVKAELNVIDKGLDVLAEVWAIPDFNTTDTKETTGWITAKYREVGATEYTALDNLVGYYDGATAYFDIADAFVALNGTAPANTQYKIDFDFDKLLKGDEESKAAAPALGINEDFGFDTIIGELGTLVDFAKGLLVDEKLVIDVDKLIDIAKIFAVDGEGKALTADALITFFDYYVAEFYDYAGLDGAASDAVADKAAAVIDALTGHSIKVADILKDTNNTNIKVIGEIIVNDGIGAALAINNGSTEIASATVKVFIVDAATVPAAPVAAADFANAIDLAGEEGKDTNFNVYYAALEGAKEEGETYYVKDADNQFVEAAPEVTEGLYTKEYKVVEALAALLPLFYDYAPATK